MHLEDRLRADGSRAIEADGWPIAARIPMAEDDDRPAGIAASDGRGAWRGSRGPSAPRARTARRAGRPVRDAGRGGGGAAPSRCPSPTSTAARCRRAPWTTRSVTRITKLAHLHFVSAAVHAARVAQMGEERWRIHIVGAPGLDRIRRRRSVLPRAALARSSGCRRRAAGSLVTFHPVTLEYAAARPRTCEELLAALEKADGTLVHDLSQRGHRGPAVVERSRNSPPPPPLPARARASASGAYVSLLRHADADGGQLVERADRGAAASPCPWSTSGVASAAGSAAPTCIDVGPTRDDILRGIEAALAAGVPGPACAAVTNPYGDGRGGGRASWRSSARCRLDARWSRSASWIVGVRLP